MGDDEVDPFTKPKLHTTAMEEGIWLGNLFKRELMPEPEQRYLEYIEADARLAEAELLNQWQEANVNEPKSTLEALDAARKERSMTGRFNVNNPPPSQPPNRMRTASRANLRGNGQPLFNTGPSGQAYSPAFYSSATTRWERISAAEFEGLIFQRAIVRVPDFDKPHSDATLAVMVLDNHRKLALQMRAFDSPGPPVQELMGMTHSTKHLTGRLGLQSYQRASGKVALDLYVDTPNGRHTVARTHTTIADWVLAFYKETP